MPYATQADLETRFGSEELAQLTDRINGSAIDEAVVARALLDADAVIDSHLAGRYQLPLASASPVLLRTACDLARYFLWADKEAKTVRLPYEDAQAFLRAVAEGKRHIGEAGALPEESAGREACVTAPSRSRVFNGGHY